MNYNGDCIARAATTVRGCSSDIVRYRAMCTAFPRAIENWTDYRDRHYDWDDYIVSEREATRGRKVASRERGPEAGPLSTPP